MGISSCWVRQCAALLPGAPVVTGLERGVSRRGPGTSAVRWSAAAGLRVGIGFGKGIAADKRIGKGCWRSPMTSAYSSAVMAPSDRYPRNQIVTRRA